MTRLRTNGWRALAGLALALSSSACGAADPPGSIRLGDQQFYSRGSYSAFASPWASYIDKSLKRGVNFSDSIVVQPATFPNGTTIEWSWPWTRPTKSGVYGYMEVSYGNYDGGNPLVRVPPSQVKDIARLSEDLSWSFSGVGGYNLLNEFYLTRAAGRADLKVIEVGLLLHPFDRDDITIQQGRYIGRYVERGRAWKVVLNGTFLMFVPEQDVAEATIDLLAMLRYLQSRGVITGNEWFNGVAFGVEPIRGWGTHSIQRWRVDYLGGTPR